MADSEHGGGFLRRWSRRKAGMHDARPLADAPPPSAPPADEEGRVDTGPDTLPYAHTSEAPQAGEPPPTLRDAEQLTPSSDFARFVAPDVSGDVRNAALKRLFADPHFNVMDGLDTYIEDFGKPDPLPLGMLRKMAQAELLNLFADEKLAAAQAADATSTHPTEMPADEDADLRLQPNDAAGPPGADAGPGPHTGGQH